MALGVLRSTGGSLVGSGAQWGDELEGQCAGRVMRTKGDALEGGALDALCERGAMARWTKKSTNTYA